MSELGKVDAMEVLSGQFLSGFVEVFGFEESVSNQECRTDEPRVSCKGGWGLVGRESVSNGACRQDLPPALSCTMQETNEFVGGRTDVSGTRVPQAPGPVGPVLGVLTRDPGQSWG